MSYFQKAFVYSLTLTILMRFALRSLVARYSSMKRHKAADRFKSSVMLIDNTSRFRLGVAS